MTAPLWALALGALAALAVLAAGMAVRSPGSRPVASRPAPIDRRAARRLLGGFVAGMAVLVTTRWVVVALAIGVGVAIRGRIFAGSGAAAERAHVEGIALWLEGVRDALRSDASLQQVLYRVAANPPAPLADALGRFERRGRQGVALTEALALLADDIGHPTADVAVASMAQSLEQSGGRVRQQLDELAATARHELAMRERIDRIRARFDVATKAMMLLAALIIGYLWFVGRVTDYYRTPTGQVTLVLPVAIWVLSLGWMRQLARYELPRRALQRRSHAAVTA